MEVIFYDYGIEISLDNGRYYLIFDDGGIVSHFTKVEITRKHAERAMKSSKDAGEVIMHYQRIKDDPKNI